MDLSPTRWWLEPTEDGRPRTKPSKASMRRESRRRGVILSLAKNDLALRERLIDACAKDPVFLANNFVWLYEPRDSEFYPMVLWDDQERYVRFVEQALADQKPFLAEKSRDAGVTYLNCLVATHRWRFVPKFKTAFCANKEGLVDTIGDPDSIFEKLRMMIDSWPRWLAPKGYSRSDHGLFLRIINPENKNVMIGNSGANAGRGGRSSWYLIDEGAHLDNADAVDLATSANTRVRGWCSSVNGEGNFFARKRHSGTIRVITMHWRKDPRKNEEWAKETRTDLGKEKFGQEYDIDYRASLTGMIIKKDWVDAAVWLWKNLPHDFGGEWCAGMDIADGGNDLSVVQPRLGPLVPKAESRAEGDTTDTANWALGICRQRGVKRLVYDSVGIGRGVHSTLKRGVHDEPNKGIKVFPCNWGLPPVGKRRWEDGRTSKETFRDIKAEVWWIMRERLRCSYELYLHLTGQEGAVEHDPSDCLLIEPAPELETQLCTVLWQTTATGGKIEIESKKALAVRGVKSPDYAEALAYSFHEPVTVDFKAGLLLGEPAEAPGLEW